MSMSLASQLMNKVTPLCEWKSEKMPALGEREKMCKRCGEFKLLEKFALHQTWKNKRNNVCMECEK